MINLYENGGYLADGELLINGVNDAAQITAKTGNILPAEASKGTMAYGILTAHNTSDNDDSLKIKFDKITSHDITFVGIIQTARASGLKEFPLPYVLTNCHNSLCAVGGTINDDDHMFGLSAAKKYGGVYVPPHQAVIHQYARECLAECGGMILGSDSHTRYGALGTMAVGEGGGELAKQLLGRTYDIRRPKVVLVYLTGKPAPYIGPHDVALALVGATFESGFVKNKVLEFAGPGVSELSADFRIGVDVMTTETTCLSSVWETDEKIEDWFVKHGRPQAYRKLSPAKVAYYDSIITIDLSEIKPMIAMPFHPSHAYPIADVKADLPKFLGECEERARVSFGNKAQYSLWDKIKDGRLYVDQGIIAGCAGGGFENICDAADILKGRSIGNDKFTLSVYPASMPVYMELIKNGAAAALTAAGAVMKTAFCGPCFGAGDTPSNNAFSIRHSTRNFPNREGSKIQNGQIASVALMDAKSIAATAANKGFLTGADELPDVKYQKPLYYFDKSIYENRVMDCVGKANPDEELILGPNIKDWPEMPALSDDLVLKVVSEIHDPVTTTDELIPSGETSSFRSNPLGLAEFTLSRKDPEYVGKAKAVHALELSREAGNVPAELSDVYASIAKSFTGFCPAQTIIGSTIYAVKPGDGSAREQAASCQKVLGGFANIAKEYATKRYRSNLINWGLIPFLFPDDELPFTNGDYLFVPGIKAAIEEKKPEIAIFVVNKGMKEFKVALGELTDDERKIILSGCLINFYK